jgi:hypothetical protein
VPGTLAARLTQARDDLAGSAGSDEPVLVTMARARRASAIAGFISALLEQEAVPGLVACGEGDAYCGEAVIVLSKIAGPELVRQYGTGPDDLAELMRAAEAGLHASASSDIETIASAMTAFTAQLMRTLQAVREDESAPPEVHSAAVAAHHWAENVWAHYGGDSGG